MTKTCYKCPRCDVNRLDDHYGLSRRDNRTQICSDCSHVESFIDSIKLNRIPIDRLIKEKVFCEKLGKGYWMNWVNWKNIELAHEK